MQPLNFLIFSTKNVKISGLFGANSERQFKHRMIHTHLNKCGMLEIIECQKLPQLKFNSENRSLAAEQLGICEGNNQQVELYDNSEVLILIPFTVARFKQIEPTSIGLKNPISSPGMMISKSEIGVNHIVHGSVGVCVEDFEGPPDTWPVFKPDINNYNSNKLSLSTKQFEDVQNVTSLVTCLNPDCQDIDEMRNFINTEMRCIQWVGCLDCITIQTHHLKTPKSLLIAKRFMDRLDIEEDNGRCRITFHPIFRVDQMTLSNFFYPSKSNR